MGSLELLFLLTNFEITILSKLTSQIFIGFLQHEIFLSLILSLQISTLLYYQKNFVIIFQLVDTSIFLKIFYGSSDFNLYLELI